MIELNNKKVILASKSPRRKELLENIGLKFEILPSDIEEKIDNYTDFGDFVMQLAKMKGEHIAKNYEEAIVISSDTVVVIDGKILEKPKDREDAFKMLKMLSGNYHDVYTSIFVKDNYLKKEIVDFVKTKVKFSFLRDEIIEHYLDTGESFDKAGAYGIQGYGSKFVEKIDGCFFSVMGFPVSLFAKIVNELGYFI